MLVCICAHGRSTGRVRGVRRMKNEGQSRGHEQAEERRREFEERTLSKVETRVSDVDRIVHRLTGHSPTRQPNVNAVQTSQLKSSARRPINSELLWLYGCIAFLPEVQVAVFFAWEGLSWRWVGRSNRHLAPESVFFTMKEKTFFFFSSRRLTCNMAGSRTPVLSFAIQAI